MAGYWTALSSHVTGSIREKDLAYLILSNDDDSRRRVAGAAVVQWEPDAWRDGGQVAWNVAGTAIAPSPLEQCCIVG